MKDLKVKEVIDCVREFHDAFKIGNENAPKAEISEKDYILRYNLMKEENEETCGLQLGAELRVILLRLFHSALWLSHVTPGRRLSQRS